MSLRRRLVAATMISAIGCAGTVDAYAATAPHKTTRQASKSAAAAAQKAPTTPVAAHAIPAVVPAVAPAAPYHPPPADAGEAVIVTGTHATNRHARQSSSPITVVSSAVLRRSGQMNLADALTKTYASINVVAMGADSAALTSSIQMRGLGPNEVLVLVDGKRRHNTANIVADSGPQFGSTGADLNMIPANMIDHIEVLEDGAAAMYGSDAIAGVVNIITKKADHGLDMSAQTGANAYNGDGWQYQLNADGGFKWGNNGFVHISGQMYHTDHMNVGAADHRLLGYWPEGADTSHYYNGVVANARNMPTNLNKILGRPEETRENLGIEWGKDLIDDRLQFYGNLTYAHRHGEAYENYRIPTIAPDMYPNGFSPTETNEENDYAVTMGLKGDRLFGNWDWDASSTYGADGTKIGNKNTANPGMLKTVHANADGSDAICTTDPNDLANNYSSEGCGWSPTQARAETYRMAQWTNNLDFRRRFNIANVVPMTLAVGGEHRLETYQIIAGNPPSYEAGGTQGYAGLGPQSAGNWNRNIFAAYIDGDFRLTKHWDLDFAGRFEHYTDVGNTQNGKISTRYDFSRRVAIRGTISTGFRAPTLAETHYSAMNVSPGGASGMLAADSPAARALGAQPLKPEQSVSESGGIVLEPIDGFHIETDVYQINLRNRIVGGGTVTGNAAVDAIRNMGYALASDADPSQVSAYYLTNGASTRTQGLDIKADYTFHLHQYGNLALSMALDLNRTRLHHNGTAPDGSQILNEQNAGYITTAYPRSKIILNAYYTVGAWDINVRQTRYGETTDMLQYSDWTNSALTCPADGGKLRYSNSCFSQFKNTPRWLTDLEVGYRFNQHFHLAVGANNIFNVRPRKVPQNVNPYGAQVYDQFSLQVPITGGYYYGRLNVTF
ncbi:TonB-dependent receptor plug domain-containing protein [Gluconacetobacter johannae]|uniref:TonB-dependent receptor n=1 Tax=Gluconacetobacter johannae TaxID=112140 RepID=A0A7W4P4I6_9PROT|nr:TonB-dependent receptor [Gluconacetobacter johannae]MBB2175093.1 TonB-dependent receptor [Gluconacetobacter johannae]